MGLDFKKILGSVAPMIGTALGGPLGGAAASMLVSKLGLQIDPKDDKAVADAVANAAMTSDGLLKLRQAEMEFQQNMAELGFKNESELEKIAADDRNSARDREKAVRDYTPEVGFYLLVGVFAFFLRWLFKYPVPPDNKAIIYSAVGSLGTLVIMAATYFYGTTRGSQSKDVLLAQSAPSNGGKK